MFSVEVRLLLSSPSQADPATADADGAVMLKVTDSNLLTYLGLQHSTRWADNAAKEYAKWPILKFLESKPTFSPEDEKTAKRRLAMHMSTALHHRRALGIMEVGNDNPVYGLAHLGNKLRLYVGTWEGEGARARIVCFPTISLLRVRVHHL